MLVASGPRPRDGCYHVVVLRISNRIPIKESYRKHPARSDFQTHRGIREAIATIAYATEVSHYSSSVNSDIVTDCDLA